MSALETVIVFGLAIVLVGCAATNDGTSASRRGQADQSTKGSAANPVVSLAGSLEPLREHFNAAKDTHRFIAILSPT